MRLLALELDDQALDLSRQLVGIAHRPARPVGQGLQPVLLVAFENPVAGLARYPDSRQTSVIASPSSSRATNRRRNSLSTASTPPQKAKSVTHVSGTGCHLCLGPLINTSRNSPFEKRKLKRFSKRSFLEA
jgi:hypothetical protein